LTWLKGRIAKIANSLHVLIQPGGVLI